MDKSTTPRPSEEVLQAINLYLDNFYPQAEALAEKLVRVGIAKSQVAGIQNIITSASRFSQINDYIKYQVGGDKQRRWSSVATILLDHLKQLEAKAIEIASEDSSKIIDIKLRLARGWISQVSAHMNFLMSSRIRVFLSYARKDEERVTQLYNKLVSADLEPWMDTEWILPGQNWEYEIKKAIREADFFVVCLSRNSVDKRGFIQKEIKTALDIQEEKLDSDIYIIPARMEECDVSERLRKFQWIDLYEKDGFPRLLKAFHKS